MSNSAYERSQAHSKIKIAELRESLEDIIPDQCTLVTCGSYARREASENSDLDYFVISKDRAVTASNAPWFPGAQKLIKEIVPKSAAAGGAFGAIVQHDEMLHDIGGDSDTNGKITRRMLLLLEGEWLANHSGVEGIRREMLERYIGETITDHQLALFLLNDIIRYYRTIAVDYEFKTNEAENPKPWAVRNIKLIFSRKLLYASGLFSVAMTSDRVRSDKIDRLNDLFSMHVIERMNRICGEANFAPVLERYNYFLEKMEDLEVRQHLERLGKMDRQDTLFRELKNEGHHFTRELCKLFDNTFDSSHPIKRAVIF